MSLRKAGAVRARHALAAALLHELLSMPRAYEIREFRQQAELDVAKIRLPELAIWRVYSGNRPMG